MCRCRFGGEGREFGVRHRLKQHQDASPHPVPHPVQSGNTRALISDDNPILPPTTLLPHSKVFSKPFRRSQLPHKSVNLSFTITRIKNKLTEICGNWLLQNDVKNTLCEIKSPVEAVFYGDPFGADDRFCKHICASRGVSPALVTLRFREKKVVQTNRP